MVQSYNSMFSFSTHVDTLFIILFDMSIALLPTICFVQYVFLVVLPNDQGIFYNSSILFRAVMDTILTIGVIRVLTLLKKRL